MEIKLENGAGKREVLQWKKSIDITKNPKGKLFGYI